MNFSTPIPPARNHIERREDVLLAAAVALGAAAVRQAEAGRRSKGGYNGGVVDGIATVLTGLREIVARSRGWRPAGEVEEHPAPPPAPPRAPEEGAQGGERGAVEESVPG